MRSISSGVPAKRPAHAPLRDTRALLRAAGLRATKPRVLIHEVLRETGGHRSADEIAALLAGRGSPLPRASVYNVLADLTAAGLLMCADLGPGRALYEVAEHWHHHFLCRVCGMVLDVPCVRGRKPCLDPPTSLPGTVEEAQVLFRGVCNRCRAASRRHP
jgi:Fur family ferric uptake transcriptional regulator